MVPRDLREFDVSAVPPRSPGARETFGPLAQWAALIALIVGTILDLLS